MSSIEQTVSELGLDILRAFLQKLSQTDINLRECKWVETITKTPDIILPTNLLLSLENLSQQVLLLQKMEAKL